MGFPIEIVLNVHIQEERVFSVEPLGANEGFTDPTVWRVREVGNKKYPPHPDRLSVVDHIYTGAPGCTIHGRNTTSRQEWCPEAQAAFAARERMGTILTTGTEGV